MTHLEGSWDDAAAAVVAALEHRRGDRRPVAIVVGELLVDADGSPVWLLQHALASSIALAPAALLRQAAKMLEAAAVEQETSLQ
jgi:hypothetical protein